MSDSEPSRRAVTRCPLPAQPLPDCPRPGCPVGPPTAPLTSRGLCRAHPATPWPRAGVTPQGTTPGRDPGYGDGQPWGQSPGLGRGSAGGHAPGWRRVLQKDEATARASRQQGQQLGGEGRMPGPRGPEVPERGAAHPGAHGRPQRGLELRAHPPWYPSLKLPLTHAHTHPRDEPPFYLWTHTAPPLTAGVGFY